MIIIGLLSPYPPPPLCGLEMTVKTLHPLIQMIPLRPLKCKTHTHTHIQNIVHFFVLELNSFLLCSNILFVLLFIANISMQTPFGKTLVLHDAFYREILFIRLFQIVQEYPHRRLYNS